jgi:transketolase
VKLCGSSAGITLGADGATHQSINDVGLMRCLPYMTVLVPADGPQTEAAVLAAYNHHGPVYLRLSRYSLPDFLPEGTPFDMGKAVVLHEGRDVALVTTGPVAFHVLEAAQSLQQKGISAGVYDFHTIKPFDSECVQSIARRYHMVFTVEEHNIIGGLGSAFAEALSELSDPVQKPVLKRLGIRDIYGESGSALQLLQKHKLDTAGITESVLEMARTGAGG